MNALLPPLPTLPGEGRTYHYHPPGRSIIELVLADHALLHRLCARLQHRPGPDGSSILCAVMCRHLSAERQYLYPAAVKVGGRAEAAVTPLLELDERLLSDVDILSGSAVGDRLWREALARMQNRLREHAGCCASELIPPMQHGLGEDDLVRLGNRWEIAQEAAPSRPHPRLPRSAPWNKLTDALAGAADKIRDGLTGRKTYPATS